MIKNQWKDPVTGNMYDVNEEGQYVNSTTGKRPKRVETSPWDKSSIIEKKEPISELMTEVAYNLYAAGMNFSLDDAISYDLNKSYLYKWFRYEPIRRFLRKRSKKNYERAILNVINAGKKQKNV